MVLKMKMIYAEKYNLLQILDFGYIYPNEILYIDMVS